MVRLMAATFLHPAVKAGFQGKWPNPEKDVIVCVFDGTLRVHVAPRDPVALRLVSTPVMGTDETDGSLLARSAGGDLAAFGVLVDRHQPQVLALADRLLPGNSGADDVAQEALVRLWTVAGSLDVGEIGAGPWLRRVVSNLCIDRLRALGRLTALDDTVAEPSEPASQSAGLEQRETSARIKAALSTLPDRQRVALALFHDEELSLADIAARLTVSVDAVESLLSRARRSLRKQLETEWRELLEDTS
jgi:RNA polymerase sigma-70 factor, ECF subfamily